MTRPAGLIIHGAGRMGQEVHEVLAVLGESSGLTLKAVVSPHRPNWLMEEIWFPSLNEVGRKPAVVIDFSAAGAVEHVANWCAEAGSALLSGTTGLTTGDLQQLKQAERNIPVLHAANFSRGANLLALLTATANRVLGATENVRITDIHHQHKTDAPSGTALELQKLMPQRKVSIDSFREGEAVGEHRVCFELGDENIELRHQANSRVVFAQGAVQAARWLSDKSAGRYTAGQWIQNA